MRTPGSFGKLTEKIRHSVECGRFCAGQNLECNGQQGIPCQYSDALAEYLVRCRASTPQVVIVHAGEVIVNKRVSVNALDGTSGRHGCGNGAATGLGRSEA